MKNKKDICNNCGHKREAHAEFRGEMKGCYKYIKRKKAVYECTCVRFKEKQTDDN